MDNIVSEETPVTPIKRVEALKPLSRDHHHSLLLSWKIREGFRREIPPKRIKSFADWFWSNSLNKHFLMEEEHIFPVLGNTHELVRRALSEHRRLKRLFEEQVDIVKSLSPIEEELESHIRFEERILFNEIQKMASEEQLAQIEAIHQEDEMCETWKDEFWK
jgi:iron-sulfur cluster repair protein YtfE (RIC family)